MTLGKKAAFEVKTHYSRIIRVAANFHVPEYPGAPGSPGKPFWPRNPKTPGKPESPGSPGSPGPPLGKRQKSIYKIRL